MAKIGGDEFMKAASKVRLLIVDVDGVMTDGSIILDDEGVQLKAFNVRDGHGIKMLQRAGVEVAIITGRKSEVVERRAAELGIDRVVQRSFDKLKAFNEMIGDAGLEAGEAAFVGDDVVDLPAMARAGLSIAVADAHEEVLSRAAFVTAHRGGRGAVREVTDLILKAKGLWDEAHEKYFKV
jgi:3-deoxy-D-manno-octulosonate 8-phosphate phosphatase (KDO 8-P phosphatase)